MREANEALDECLQHFLDQRPASKGISQSDRAAGLAAAPFWQEAGCVGGAKLSALALSRMLQYEHVVPTALIAHLAAHSADVLRWAIRYSKLFMRRNSPLWTFMRQQLLDEEWRTFFGVCDRLLAQLEPFAELIQTAQQQVSRLSLLETLSYLSVLAYEEQTPDTTEKNFDRSWKVFNRIIAEKLKSADERDFSLGLERLGRSLKRHLSPILFPSPNITEECRHNLEAFALLIYATGEHIDYEDSIDWFCFDPECRYRLKPGTSVIYNETDNGSRNWLRTDRKSRALSQYWINRGLIEFTQRGMIGARIGSEENRERNTEAFIKALRGNLQLQEIYGLDDEIELADGERVDLFQALLASELHSAFFQNDFIQPFQRHYSRHGIVAKALSQMAFEGAIGGENRFPMTWSEEKEKIARTTGWTVCAKHPQGSPKAAKAILSFWTSDLKALSERLKQQPNTPIPTLYERPFYKIGHYNFQFPWVVAQQNNLTAAVNNLRRIGSRRKGQLDETHRVEQRLADLMRQKGFAVEVGYQPERAADEDPGEIDLICFRDGVLLLLEVKSGYIRSSTREIWLHRTNTLRKAAWQLRRKSVALRHALVHDQALRDRLGCTERLTNGALHAWIVDTSIELDQELIDGFLVVSLESLHIILRDECELLYPFESLSEEPAGSLFPNGFSARTFARIVETGALWMELN